jgi:hypothetical protein
MVQLEYVAQSARPAATGVVKMDRRRMSGVRKKDNII